MVQCRRRRLLIKRSTREDTVSSVDGPPPPDSSASGPSGDAEASGLWLAGPPQLWTWGTPPPESASAPPPLSPDIALEPWRASAGGGRLRPSAAWVKGGSDGPSPEGMHRLPFEDGVQPLRGGGSWLRCGWSGVPPLNEGGRCVTAQGMSGSISGSDVRGGPVGAKCGLLGTAAAAAYAACTVATASARRTTGSAAAAAGAAAAATRVGDAAAAVAACRAAGPGRRRIAARVLSASSAEPPTAHQVAGRRKNRAG
eukprot:scaffold2854_cov116-Isochrysis_galbana.AAC.6